MANESKEVLDIDEISSERKNWNDTEKYQLENGAFLSYSKIADNFEIYLRAFKRYGETEYHYHNKINRMMSAAELTLVMEFNDIFDSKGQEYHIEDTGIKSVSGDLIYDILKTNPRLFLERYAQSSISYSIRN